MKRAREKLKDALATEAKTFEEYCEACDTLKALGEAAQRGAYERRGRAEGLWAAAKLDVVNAARVLDVELEIADRHAAEGASR